MDWMQVDWFKENKRKQIKDDFQQSDPHLKNEKYAHI